MTEAEFRARGERETALEIRLLTGADAAAFQVLRLRALHENPEAFGSTYAEEADRPLDEVAARLSGSRGAFVIGGAFGAGGVLVGIVGCYRESRVKRRHEALVWGMYVAPEARGRGLGGALLDALIARARSMPGLEQLTLSVIPENVAARQLYISRGFQSFGTAPRALRDEERAYDLEYFWLPLLTG